MSTDTMIEEMKWYMIRCATGKEQKAILNIKFELELNNLDKYVEEIVCPREHQVFMRNQKKIKREKVMFPGYFLIKMKPIGEVPRIILRTNYIAEIMGNTQGPEALKDSEVKRIFGNVEKSTQEIDLLEGEEVDIVDGPFNGFKGTIKSVNKEKEKVVVDVMVFGQPTPVELGFLQIDKG